MPRVLRVGAVLSLLAGVWFFSSLAFMGLEARAQVLGTTSPAPAAQQAVASGSHNPFEMPVFQALISLFAGAVSAGILLGSHKTKLARAEERANNLERANALLEERVRHLENQQSNLLGQLGKTSV